MRNYEIVLSGKDKKNVNLFLKLLQQKNERFQLAGIEDLNVKEVERKEGCIFVYVDSEKRIDDYMNGEFDILFDNKYASNPLEIICKVYQEVLDSLEERHKATNLQDNRLKSSIVSYKKDPSVLLELIKNHLKELPIGSPPLSVQDDFNSYLKLKEKPSGLRLLNYYHIVQSLPDVEALTEDDIPFLFDDLRIIKLDWKNTVLSLGVNISIKDAETKKTLLSIPLR